MEKHPNWLILISITYVNQWLAGINLPLFDFMHAGWSNSKNTCDRELILNQRNDYDPNLIHQMIHSSRSAFVCNPKQLRYELFFS